MTDGGTCGCKIGRVARQYGLSDLDADLRHRYGADASLRDLEALVNRRILRSAIDRTDGDVSAVTSSDQGVAALFDVLDDEQRTATAERARVRTRLEQAGVDVEAVTDDWVSHATIRTHLNDCLDVATSRDASITHEEAVSTVEWTRSRSRNVVSETVKRLGRTGAVEIAEPTVSLAVRITCEACGRSYSIQDLLENGGCACDRDRIDPDQQ